VEERKEKNAKSSTKIQIRFRRRPQNESYIAGNSEEDPKSREDPGEGWWGKPGDVEEER